MPCFRCHSKYLNPVPEVLSDISSVQEVLWNFSNFKDEKNRLTLRDNPRFHEKLPTSPKAYGASLKIDPIENFLHANDFDVLIDKAEPVHIMTKRDTQVFGNFWCPQKAIIFKGLNILILFFPCFLCFSRHLWEAQGGKNHQGISQRHTLWAL